MIRFTEFLRISKAFLIAVLMSLLLLASCGGEPEVAESRAPRPNILLVLIDTFRADHAGCYGYYRETTPVLDSLATVGVRYAAFQSHSSWTLPAMTSLLTGLTEREHGAGMRGRDMYGIDTGLPYLPHILNREGYVTGAFFNVVYMDADFGFHRGFDHFDCEGLTSRLSLRRADETVDECISWLNSLPPEKPFLAAVHFYDPHISYNPPAPWDALFADPAYRGPYGPEWGEVPQLKAVNSGDSVIPPAGLENLIGLYDGELAFTDAHLGRLFAYLRRRGLDSNTVVVVTADHGEEFVDHGGIEHGHTLYQELLAVPLVISGPGVPEGRVVEETAAGIDLLPSLLVMLDMEVPAVCGGIDLLSGLPPDRAVSSSGTLWAEGSLASCVAAGNKVIWSADTDRAVGYRISSDPGELTPVEPDSALLERVMEYWATPPVGDPPEVDYSAAVDRTLRDLGYIR